MHSHFLPFSFWSFISRDSHNLYVSEFLIAICRKCLAILSWKYVERVTRTHRTETGNPGWEYGWTPQCSGVCRWDHAADASWSAATRRWHPPPPSLPVKDPRSLPSDLHFRRLRLVGWTWHTCLSLLIQEVERARGPTVFLWRQGHFLTQTVGHVGFREISGANRNEGLDAKLSKND